MASLKINFIYKSILSISNYLIAFIVFPYISRILGVENIGLVNFVDNTINYFLIFATMGVTVLGTREIAGAGDDLSKRSKVFSNILGINLLFTLVTLLLYFILIISIPKFWEYKELMYVGSAKILFSAFLIEWFFTGIENFRYITIRSMLIKIIYVACVFIFVKNPAQYKLYFYLTIALTVINSLINLIYSNKFVKINFRELFNYKYVKQNISLGIYGIMTSMYLTFNVMYLGFVADNIQVGYYTTAFKVYSVVLGFFSAFTSVMLPRMSSLVANDDNERFRHLAEKSFGLVSTFSIPLIICSIILAEDIIYVLSGPGYEGAVLPMKIIMPAVLCVGISQIIAIQILMPLRKDKVLLISSFIGAVVSILINVFLVGHLKSTGSAIVLLASEFIVTLFYVLYIIKYTSFGFKWKYIINNILLSVPSAIMCIIITSCVHNHYVALSVALVSSVLVWVICVFIYQKLILGRQTLSIRSS